MSDIIVAAKSINGSLLKIVFEKVAERVIELLSLSRSINNSEFDAHAIFLRTAYQHSSETDQEALAAVINSNDVLLSYVINTISSILTSQEGFQVMWDEASHTSGILSLIALILNAWKYKSSISATLSGNLDSLCASLDLCLKEKDIATWSQDSVVCSFLCYLLEILCLSVLHFKLQCMELIQKLFQFPNALVGLFSKAAAGLISLAHSQYCTELPLIDLVCLSDEEIAVLIDLLEPIADPCRIYVSESVFIHMIKGLKCNEVNRTKLKNSDLPMLMQEHHPNLIDKVLLLLDDLDAEMPFIDIVTSVDEPFVKSGLSGLVLSLLEYFVSTMCSMDLPVYAKLVEGEYHNISSSLILLEEVLSQSNDTEQSEIISTIVAYPKFAKAAAILLEHVKDKGFQTICVRLILMLVMELTDNSLIICRELGLSGFVAHILGIVKQFTVRGTLITKEGDIGLALLCLTVLLNCSKEPNNLPVFEAASAPHTILPFLQSQVFDILVISRTILSFLTPCLTNEEFLCLTLKPEEAAHYVLTISQALQSPDMKGEEGSAEEFLQFLINYTKPVISFSDRKKSRKSQYSDFQAHYDNRAKVFQNNVKLLLDSDVVPCIYSVLEASSVPLQVMEYTLQLLWNVLHFTTDIALPLEAILANIHSTYSSSTEIVSLIVCIQHLLCGLDNIDLSAGLQYAQTCYGHKYFQECVNVCKSLRDKFTSQLKPGLSVTSTLNLLHGKAMYHCFQPELWHLIKERDNLSKKEIQLVSDECFEKMKVAISLLGVALDHQFIDAEGSRLLDLAMTSCATDLNYLGNCERCLLCRRGQQKLRKSHLWPSSILKRIYKADFEGDKKPFLFGLRQDHPKTFKECTFNMFCPTCEEVLSQNGEQQFANLIDSFEETSVLEYGSWLYDFAIGMIFRHLATEHMSYFPNSTEVYNAFLSCRAHIFKLSTKLSSKSVTLSELCSPSTMDEHQGKLTVYMIRCPAELASARNEMIRYFSKFSYCFGSVSTCRLIDAKLDSSGCIHFLVIYCQGFHILLKFSASQDCIIPDEYRINEVKSRVSLEDDVSSVPDGVWSVLQHAGAIAFESRMSTYQRMSDLTLQALSSSSDKVQQQTDGKTSEASLEDCDVIELACPLDVSESDTGHMFLSLSSYSFNFLPLGYVVDGNAGLVQLPSGHQVIWHFSTSTQKDKLLMTYFFCFSDETGFYMILVNHDAKSDLTMVDGFQLSIDENGSTTVSGFLLEDRPGLERLPRPFSIEQLNHILDLQLSTLLSLKGFKSMSHLLHLFKCSKPTKCTPSLDFICYPHCCWYCRNLCHCCMFPVSLSEGKTVELEAEEEHQKSLSFCFCSDECLKLVIPESGAPPTVSVTYNKPKPGKVIGPAKLVILKSMVPDGEMFSQLELIQVCIDVEGGKLPAGKPYIIWQIRSISSQKFMDFFISNNFEATTCLWTSQISALNIDLNDPAVSERIYTLMKNVLELVLHKIGFSSLDDFVASNIAT